MNTQEMGHFIAELRKEKKLTQSGLAEALHITDKAVSKWERGISCPDISLLSDLARILGVSVNELLQSDRDSSVTTNAVSDTPDVAPKVIENVLQYTKKTAEQKSKTVQKWCIISFYLMLLTGIVTCAICNMAISGSFTWALIPIYSCIFTGLFLLPFAAFGKKGLPFTLAALSVLIFPFLYSLSVVIKCPMIFTIGTRTAIAGIIYMWAVFALFTLLAQRKMIAASLSILCAAPICLYINYYLSIVINEPFIDVWDILTYAILFTASIVFFILHTRRKSHTN